MGTAIIEMQTSVFLTSPGQSIILFIIHVCTAHFCSCFKKKCPLCVKIKPYLEFVCKCRTVLRKWPNITKYKENSWPTATLQRWSHHELFCRFFQACYYRPPTGSSGPGLPANTGRPPSPPQRQCSKLVGKRAVGLPLKGLLVYFFWFKILVNLIYFDK